MDKLYTTFILQQRKINMKIKEINELIKVNEQLIFTNKKLIKKLEKGEKI